MENEEYLWLNLSDLSEMGSVGNLCNPIYFMVCPDLGDENVGTYAHADKLDEVYIVLKSSAERCKAIREAMELIGEKKIGRKVRTRTTKNSPRANWRWLGSW